MSSNSTFVLPVSTASGKESEVSTSLTEDVVDLKKRLCKQLGVSQESVSLLSNGRELVEGALSSNGVGHKSRLFLVPEMRSGLRDVRDNPSLNVQGLAKTVLQNMTPDQLKSTLQAKTPVKLNFVIPQSNGSRARVEVMVTPSVKTSSNSESSHNDRQTDSTPPLPEFILYQRLSQLSMSCMAKRSLLGLRALARVVSNVSELPVESGICASDVHRQHRLLDYVQQLLANSSSREKSAVREIQQLLCDVSKMLDGICAAVRKRELSLAKSSTSASSSSSSLSSPSSSPSPSFSTNASAPMTTAAPVVASAPVFQPCSSKSVIDGRLTREPLSAGSRDIVGENKTMHRKLLQLQKAMSERRRARDHSKRSNRKPIVIHPPPPATGFGGLRRGFLLAKA